MSHPYFTHRFDSSKAPEKIWASWLLPALWQSSWQDLATHFSLSEPIQLGSTGLVTFAHQGSYQLQIIEFDEQERLTMQFRSHTSRFNIHYSIDQTNPEKIKVRVSLTVEQPIDSSSLVSTLINPVITRHITAFQSLHEKSEAPAEPATPEPAEPAPKAEPVPEPVQESIPEPIVETLSIDTTAKPPTTQAEKAATEPESVSSSTPSLPSLGYTLWQISNRWQSQVRTALKPHGLTPTQWLLLFTLVRMEKDELVVTPTLLAQALSLNTMLVSDVVKLLVNKHLVHKIKIMPDRRSFKISATAGGKITAVEAHTDVILAEKRFFRDLAEDERPIGKYLELMKQQIAAQATQGSQPAQENQSSNSTTSGK